MKKIRPIVLLPVLEMMMLLLAIP